MKGRIITGIFCLLLAGKLKVLSQPQNNYRLTLKQCVESAIKNNLQVQQSDLQLQAGAVNLSQAKTNLFPDLFANLNHGMNQGRSIDPFTNSYINQQITYGNYNVSSSVVLFNGFQAKNLIKQNTLVNEANKLDLQQTKDNVTLNVILAYLQILNNEEQLLQSKNQAEVTRRQAERLSVMNESGAVAPAELYDLKGQLGNDELAIVTNQNALNAAKLLLAQLMNVNYRQDLTVEKINADTIALPYDNNPAALYNISVKELAIVKAADLRRQSAAKGIQVARGLYYPTINLSGSFNTNYSNAATKDVQLNTVETSSGDYVDIAGSKIPVITTKTNFANKKIAYGDQFKNNYNTAVFLSLQIPILNKFRAKNQVLLAKIDLRNAEVAEQTVRTQLNQNVEQAYFNMTASLQKYKTLQQQVSDFSESFRTAEVRFEAGAITQVDYLIAKNNVDRARANLISTKYDYLFRIKILDYYQNNLSLE